MKAFFQTIFWIFKKFIFGYVALYSFNFIGSYIGVEIASNYISYFLIGAFGLPGLLIVYIANLLFF